MSVVRGWCPTAWRPMAAGDGLILRVRPRLARLTPAQARTIAVVARTHGNGLIDLTNRAALQLRGLREADWPVALGALVAAGLVDPDPVREARALLVAPDWREGDDTHRIACALLDRLDALPPLPGKIGIAIDAGREPVLTDSPADFRIERGATGGLILRAEGRAGGYALTPGEETTALIALAEWFVASGGVAAGRMARHVAPLPANLAGGATTPSVPAKREHRTKQDTVLECPGPWAPAFAGERGMASACAKIAPPPGTTRRIRYDLPKAPRSASPSAGPTRRCSPISPTGPASPASA